MAEHGTVFLSYARADDEKPPFSDTTQGWVTFFWHQLRWELTSRGAKTAKLWRDRYEIEPADEFTKKIEDAVSAAAVVLPVFSPNWILSDWCRREVDTFQKAHPDAGKRIVPVFKADVEPGKLPALMQGDHARTGYRFFEVDAEGKLHEFYWRGLKDTKRYEDLLRDIAYAVLERLGLPLSEPAKAAAMSSDARAVCVAYAAADLRDARQRLVNDLVAAGYRVLPEQPDAPDDAAELERAIRTAVSEASLVVHLLGVKEGPTPEGADTALVPFQLRVVRQAIGERTIPRVLWAPRWVPGAPNEKRDPFEVARRYGAVLKGEEVHGAELTDLSQWIRKHFERAPTPRPEADKRPTLLIASAAPEDDPLATIAANRLQPFAARVERVLAGAEPPAAGADLIVLIPWGQASVAALENLLKRFPQPGRVHCLRLPGGDTHGKSLFYVPGVIVDDLEGLPETRDAARKLLESLEIISPESERP